MASCHIVPVESADGDGETLVIEVQQEGSHPLDVRIVGSEGEHPYVTSSKIGPITKFASHPLLTPH
jgi:hypothetical protein